MIINDLPTHLTPHIDKLIYCISEGQYIYIYDNHKYHDLFIVKCLCCNYWTPDAHLFLGHEGSGSIQI